MNGNAPLEEWLVHDRWFADSCQRRGYLASERLGNISMAAHIRELIYSATHTGDWLPSAQVEQLLEGVKVVFHSTDILSELDRNLFAAVRRLCAASIRTGNPIMF